jgi:membrane protein required for colicin V production
MHWLDIIILVVLGLGAAMGFWSGLLWQVARVVSLGLSLYVAIVTNSAAADWLDTQWRDVTPAVNHVVAFIGVFLGVYLTLYLITRLLHKAIKASKLETLDRLLGALLGIAKMAAVAATICAVMAALDLEIFKEWFAEAKLAPAFAKGSEVAVKLVPQEYREQFDDRVEQVRDQMQKKVGDVAVDALKNEIEKKQASK